MFNSFLKRKERGRPLSFLRASLAPRHLAKDLDADANNRNGAEDGQDDRQDGADAVHDIGSHGGEAGAKRGDDGIGSGLSDPLLSSWIMLCE